MDRCGMYALDLEIENGKYIINRNKFINMSVTG
jgi:hypothetical protein